MDTLRSLHRLRWWIVAWFFLSLGVTTAAPLMQPRNSEQVCSASQGIGRMAQAKTGHALLHALGMDCPLCLLGSAPPQPTAFTQPALPAPHQRPASPVLARAMARMAALPPARGPPLSSI